MSTIYAVTVDNKTVYHGYLFYKATDYYNRYRSMNCKNCIYSTVRIPAKDVVNGNEADIPIANRHCIFYNGRVEDPYDTFITDIVEGDNRPYVRVKCMNYGQFSNCHNVRLETIRN